MRTHMESLKDSYIFQIYNKSIDIEERMNKLVSNGEIVTKNQLIRNINEIDKMYSFASKPYIESYLDSDRILMYYIDNPQIDLPSTIPFFLYNVNGKVKCICDLSRMLSINKNGVFNVSTQSLFNILQGGVTQSLSYEKFRKLQINSDFIKSTSICYSKLMNKVFGYLLTFPYPSDEEKLAYLTSLFYLIKQLGLDFEDPKTHNYAAMSCSTVGNAPIREIMMKYKPSDFENFKTFCGAISTNEYFAKDLTITGFINKYLKMYMENMIFSIEYLPIFLYNLFAVEIGAFINNKNSIENNCGRYITDAYHSFFQTTR